MLSVWPVYAVHFISCSEMLHYMSLVQENVVSLILPPCLPMMFLVPVNQFSECHANHSPLCKYLSDHKYPTEQK